MDLITYLMASEWGQYVIAASTILSGLTLIASAITPLTSTSKDDEILAKVKAFLHRFAVTKPKA